MVSTADGLTLGLIVFAVVLAESLVITDFLVPGEVGLVVAGAAAARNDTPLGILIAAAACGAVAGDVAGYVAGRRFGTDLVGRWRVLRRLRRNFTRARRYFDRHGPVTVAAARWVGALRAVVPLVAGTARLSSRRFVIAAVPSAIAWSATMSSAGFHFGDDIAEVVDRVGIGMSAAVVAGLVVAVVAVRRRRAGG